MDITDVQTLINQYTNSKTIKLTESQQKQIWEFFQNSNTSKLTDAEIKTAIGKLLGNNRKIDFTNITHTQNSKPYQMGERRGNTRIISTNQVMGGTNNMTTISFNGLTFSVPSNNTSSTTYNNTADGYIGTSRQDQRGDCYFLAEINAIRNTKNGQAVLQKNCKKNRNGSYTITLPGAIKIREDYAKKGLKCEVTGTYTISKSALEKAITSRKYSEGDVEVIAFELAMEAYRAEMIITNKENGTSTTSVQTAEGNVPIQQSDDVLSGGWSVDAGFILTGQKAVVYNGRGTNHMENLQRYQYGKYGFITREEMANRTGADISMYNTKSMSSTPSTSEISSYSTEEKSINEMLNKYQGKEGEYALTFGVRTLLGAGHALTIVKITDSVIYVVDPNHPEQDKIQPIPRKDFIKMCTHIDAIPIKQEFNPSDYQNAFNQFFSTKK